MPRLFNEIKAQGFTGSMNLLTRYINQGRVESDRASISPRKLAELILTNPTSLATSDREMVDQLTTSCPEMTALTEHVRAFADLLRPAPENAQLLNKWIDAARADDLPYLHAFTRGSTTTGKRSTPPSPCHTIMEELKESTRKPS